MDNPDSEIFIGTITGIASPKSDLQLVIFDVDQVLKGQKANIKEIGVRISDKDSFVNSCGYYTNIYDELGATYI